MTTRKGTLQGFVLETSQFPRNARTLRFQMAMEKQRQLEVAGRIRDLRGPKPQPVIADEVGVKLRTYQHWEAGDGIAWENLQKLATVFGVSENYLLYGDEKPKAPELQLDRIESKLDWIAEVLATQLAGVAPPEMPAELGRYSAAAQTTRPAAPRKPRRQAGGSA